MIPFMDVVWKDIEQKNSVDNNFELAGFSIIDL